MVDDNVPNAFIERELVKILASRLLVDARSPAKSSNVTKSEVSELLCWSSAWISTKG